MADPNHAYGRPPHWSWRTWYWVSNVTVSGYLIGVPRFAIYWSNDDPEVLA